ncbi:hypothetical protein BH09PLA1_BH09PLA1_28590 [soil metagenome]
MLKLQDNPPIASPEDLLSSSHSARLPWLVGHTKARCEKVFAQDLLVHSIDYFLPMVPRVTISGGRKRRGMAALFPSYVFFCGDEPQRAAALATDRLCQVIPVRDQARLTTELAALDRLLRGGMQLELHPFATIGRRCRIVAGPFAGLEGTVVQRKDDRLARLILEVSMLGQGAAVELEADLLEPVDEGARSPQRATRR